MSTRAFPLVAGCAIASALAGCVAPPPPASPTSVAGAPITPPSAADAALARDAALAGVAPATAGVVVPAPVLVHAPVGGGATVDVATLALPDAVLFDFGVARPRPDAAPVLDALARAVAASPQGTVATVAGNTDSVGSADFNQALSDARAANVVAALAARGIDPARLAAIGFGRRRPVATNDTAAGRAANRRVEVALSPSLAANLAALGQLAPARAVVPDAATIPAAASVPAAAAPSGVHQRRPTPLQIRPNTPETIRPNSLGPTVPF